MKTKPFELKKLVIALTIIIASLPINSHADTRTMRLEKASGERDHFSPWFELCSDPIPDNQVIVSQSFKLEGDRKCNEWSRCELTKNSSTQVCWSFALQGHSESILTMKDNGSKNSIGVLTVTTKPKS